jgi:hypothetical protein
LDLAVFSDALFSVMAEMLCSPGPGEMAACRHWQDLCTSWRGKEGCPDQKLGEKLRLRLKSGVIFFSDLLRTSFHFGG